MKRIAVISLFASISGCSCEPNPPPPLVDAGADASAGDSGFRTVDSSVGTDAGVDSGFPRDPCGDVLCEPGQRCETVGTTPACINNECSDLSCASTERCEPHPLGGHVCVSIACTSDVQCDVDDYCNGTICVDDVCVPGTFSCLSNGVRQCSSSGSGVTPLYECMSAGYFASACIDGGMGDAGCTCEDDWDCPAFTECEGGTCVGTGVAPTCTLPPIPFSDVLPAVEIEWGGESRTNDTAFDGTADRNESPWSNFGHVVSTPIVANLDDDNGDGLINEFDFPEILFTAHRGNNPWGNGVLRAIHGGGPNKGADYFARCRDKLWTRAAPTTDTCGNTEPDADAGAPVAVGDINGDGVPEIVYMTEGNSFRILDNTGAEMYSMPGSIRWDPTTVGETATIANLDYQGYAELIVGRSVYVFIDDGFGGLFVSHVFEGSDASGANQLSTMTCPADVRDDLPGQELVAGATLYRLPTTLPACGSPPCTAALETVWDATDLPGQSSLISGDGFCAVADIWGADPDEAPGPANPLDGVPEIILIDNGDLTILNASTGAIIEDRDLGGGSRGGAPNVDDFDGDGFMEVASALQNFYVVEDLQDSTGTTGSCPSWPTVIDRADGVGGSHNSNPARSPGAACTADADCDAAAVCNTTLGQCVCLHNGWKRDSDDDSSRATSSSVFDFNGDGAAEVLYNDECDFRVYDGVNGEVLFTEISRSRTGIENPVVADVDNDGNAEVVSASNTAQGQRCDEDGANPIGPNGVRVWGDPTDTWVSARRIWNQQSYHVVNVTEGGQIPAHPPESWSVLNGRTYNTYRSQPRNFGVAPDLVVGGIGISSPDTRCGVLSDTIDINVQIANQGDLRVGAGVPIAFYGTWVGSETELLDAAGDPLRLTLSGPLEPGRSVFLSVNYDRAYNGEAQLPDSIRVVVDPPEAGLPNGTERECLEANNELGAEVDGGEALPDLRIDVGMVTPMCAQDSVQVAVTISNSSDIPATDVLVRLYAGDPAAGGSPLADAVRPGPLTNGADDSFTVTVADFPKNREILIYGVVDPDGSIEECNEANNVDPADNVVVCPGLI